MGSVYLTTEKVFQIFLLYALGDSIPFWNFFALVVDFEPMYVDYLKTCPFNYCLPKLFNLATMAKWDVDFVGKTINFHSFIP